MDASTGRSEGTIASIQPHRNDEAQPSCSTSVSDARSDVGEENQPKPNRNTFALEVPVLLLFFSWNLSATVFQNQILFQTCKISFPFNNTYCTDLINGDVIDKVAVRNPFLIFRWEKISIVNGSFRACRLPRLRNMRLQFLCHEQFWRILSRLSSAFFLDRGQINTEESQFC